jgi:hypothetical protein
MTTKRCSHKISINLDFLKRIFSIPEKSALHYSTISTTVDILNDMTPDDLMKLANWIITSGVARSVKVVELPKEAVVEIPKEEDVEKAKEKNNVS